MRKEKAPRQRGHASETAAKTVPRGRFKSNRAQRIAANAIWNYCLCRTVLEVNGVLAIWAYSQETLAAPEPIAGYAV